MHIVRYLFQQAFFLICCAVFHLFGHSLHASGQFIPIDFHITTGIGQLQRYYATTQRERGCFAQFHHNETGHPGNKMK